MAKSHSNSGITLRIAFVYVRRVMRGIFSEAKGMNLIVVTVYTMWHVVTIKLLPQLCKLLAFLSFSKTHAREWIPVHILSIFN